MNPNEYYIYSDELITEINCILIPNSFRLRFDYDDTLGHILGFKNPGCPSSITCYATKQSNKDYYEYQKRLEEMSLIPKNPEIICAPQIDGDSYIIMVINELKTLYTLGKIKDAFTKILLCDEPGKVLFNTFVPTFYFFDDPINELFELTISFYQPNGQLYDFNGIDHSFTLEIVTIYDIPEGAGLSIHTGKNYNQDIG